jgi:hypothetical protein
VNIDLLEIKLFDIPPKLEAEVQNDRVLLKEELIGLLKDKFNMKNPDLVMILHFLVKFKFIRKSVKKNNIFYIVGETRDEKVENYEIEMKIMKMGMKRMIQKKEILADEVKNIIKHVKTIPNENLKKKLKLKCVAKAKIVNKLKKQILVIQTRINQSSNMQDDVNMMRLMKETALDPSQMDEVRDVLEDQMNMQKEMNDQQAQLQDILDMGQNQNNEDDVLNQMFNALDTMGEANEEFENIYNQSKIIASKKTEEIDTKVLDPKKNIKEEVKEDNTPEPLPKQKSENKIYGIDDVVQYHEQKHGKIEPEQKEIVYNQNRTLVFNSKKNGLRNEKPTGKSFGDYKKQKSMKEQVNNKN